MIFLQANAYDPNAEEGRGPQRHVTRKDLIKVAVIVLVLLLVVWPVYLKLKANRDKHVCKDNLGQIARAVLLYAESNSGRLPPVFVTGDNYEPRLFNGKASTWMSLIAGDVKNPNENFTCPSAQDAENAPNEGGKGVTIMSSYGMFAALSAASLSNIPNQGAAAMIAETSSNGAGDTYDPHPLLDVKGKPVPDGYTIGFDTSNFTPLDDGRDLIAKARYATRLAYGETSKGKFSETGPVRHEGGIHMLFADGHVKTVKPPTAVIHRIAGGDTDIVGTWAIR